MRRRLNNKLLQKNKQKEKKIEKGKKGETQIINYYRRTLLQKNETKKKNRKGRGDKDVNNKLL